MGQKDDRKGGGGVERDKRGGVRKSCHKSAATKRVIKGSRTPKWDSGEILFSLLAA